jgi:hypothetical protein
MSDKMEAPRLVLRTEDLPDTFYMCVLYRTDYVNTPMTLGTNTEADWYWSVPRYTLLGVLGNYRVIPGTNQVSVDHGTIKLDIERLAFGRESLVEFPYEIIGGGGAQGIVTSICWQYRERMREVNELIQNLLIETPIWGKPKREREVVEMMDLTKGSGSN